MTKEEQQRNRQEWVDALRSGKYRQGNGYLGRLSGERCCLGVACDLHDVPTTPNEFILFYKFADGVESNGIIPDKYFAEWFGFPKNNTALQRELCSLNDHSIYGQSFDHIARRLETEFFPRYSLNVL